MRARFHAALVVQSALHRGPQEPAIWKDLGGLTRLHVRAKKEESVPAEQAVSTSLATQDWVGLIMCMSFLVLGFFMMTKRGVAEWGLQRGRARIWVRLLGEERAVWVTQRIFAPLTMLLGLGGLLGFAAQLFKP
jgi:hypothetical protein